MRLCSKWGSFLAFAALFAAGAGFVFWGTWSMDLVPIMPDCPTSFPADYAEEWMRGWNRSGKFVPGDIIAFIGSPYFWVELRYVLPVFFAALGMAYFLRGRGLSRPASYGAGLFLAFSGYWLTLFSAGHLGWFQWMTYGVFAFGLIDRAFAKGKIRHWALLGAVLAWGSFYQPDLWLLFTVFTAVYFAYRYAASALANKGTPPRERWIPVRWLKGAAVSLAVFVLIGLPSFRSAIFGDLASRDKQIDSGETVSGGVTDESEKRWIFVTNWSMPPEDTREFWNARVHGDTSCPMTLAIGEGRGNGIKPYAGRLGRPLNASSGNYRQHSLYVGWLTCLMAIVGVLTGFKNRDVLFFLACGTVFWLFSLGRFCEPVYRIVYSLPMGDYLRAPVKWHHLTEFCIVVLAGYGLQSVYSALRASESLPRFMAPAAILFLVAVGIADLAKNDALYCAPHAADATVAPLGKVIAEVPENPSRAESLIVYIRESLKSGGKEPYVFGKYIFEGPKGAKILGPHHYSAYAQDGSEFAIDLPVVEFAAERPKLSEQGEVMGDGPFLMAVVSILVSGLAVGLLVFTALNSRVDGKLRFS
ncbi:MAG: hypothetical protein K6F50_01420 [Kiritimatiellae bacterium]|nr:hypothetical protein [Kiritimatiellia bacterium]